MGWYRDCIRHWYMPRSVLWSENKVCAQLVALRMGACSAGNTRYVELLSVVLRRVSKEVV